VPLKRPRVTVADPAFREAVARGLKRYRDGNNPEQMRLTDAELAKRLGVSKPTLSKYLNCKQIIGGEHLVRALIQLGISVVYGRREIGARALQTEKIVQQVPEQICFIFETLCLLNETDGSLAVTLDRKQPPTSQLTIHVTKKVG
jgi:transcriptional regulator with XRE-family HTH domain